MKVALVYDRVNTWGGAERVLLALHSLFPSAPLYTSFFNSKKAEWARVFDVRTSFMQKVFRASSNHELLPLCMPMAFESMSFDEYDLVISVTSDAAKGIITKPSTKHICYCLTPTRYLWSGYDEYFKNPAVKFLTRPAISYLRKWDAAAAARPDIFIGISKEVQKRIKTYYQRDSELIYPPMMLSIFEKSEEYKKDFERMNHKKENDYFLIVSRLSRFAKYKHIDLAIKACSKLRMPLKIVGTGNWENELKAMAGPTVEFLGNVTDKKLVACYMSCKALILPGVDDFGLTAVEAQLYGKPVIAYRAGGATETVIEKKTGYFFDKHTETALIESLNRFKNFSYDKNACIRQAKRFSFEKFRQDFLKLVDNAF
jgi:glycosyltransferase involved in cell wall biosynthesis